MNRKWLLSFLVVLMVVMGISFGRVDGAETETPVDLCAAPYTLFDGLILGEDAADMTMTRCELFDEEDGSLRYVQSFEITESEEALVGQIMAWYADVSDEDVQEGIQSLKSEDKFRVHQFRVDNGEKLLVQVYANDGGWFDVELSQIVPESNWAVYDAFLKNNFQESFFAFGAFEGLMANGGSALRDFSIDFRYDQPVMSSEMSFSVGESFGVYKEYVYSGNFAEDLGNQLLEEPSISEGGWTWAFYSLKNDVLLKVALIEESSTIMLVEDGDAQEFLSAMAFLPLETSVEIELDAPLDILKSDLNVFQGLEMPEGFELIGIEARFLPHETVEISEKYVTALEIEDALPILLATLENGEAYSVDELLQINAEQDQIRLEQETFLNGRKGHCVISPTDGGTEVKFFVEDYTHYMSWQNFWAKNFNFSFYSGSIFEDLLENNTLSEKMVALYFQNGKFEVSSEVLLNLRDDYNYVLLSLASDEFENHIKGQLKETPMAESGENHWFDYALKNEVNLKFDLSDLDQSVIFSQSLGKNEMVASVDLVNENDSGQIGIDRPSDLLNIAEDVFDELAFPDGFEETKIEFEVNEFGNVVLVKNFEIQLNQEELLQGLNGLLLDGFALPDEAVAVNEDNPVFLNGLALKGNLIGEIIIEEKERQLEMSLVVNLPKQGQRVKDGLALNFNANLIDFGALPSIFEQDAIMQETFVIVDALEGSSFVHERGYAVGDRLSDYENYLLSDEFVKNIAGFLRDEPYQNCEEDCFIEFRFKNGLRLSFQFSKDSGEIYVKETLLEDRFFSELNVTDSNEKLVIVETPIDFFGSEINPFIVDLETIPIVVDSTKIMLEEFDKTNLIQFWHTDVRDATMLITAFVDAFGVPTGEEVSSLENKLVNEGEVELDFIVAGEIEDVDFHVFIMEIENGFEGTVFYQDQMHPESFALMVEKNFNDELIPFGDYSNLFEKDETVREEMSFYFDKEESWSFESVKLYMLGGDYSIYADYFTLDKFVSELETMGATHFETWFDEGQRVIHYMLFGVDVSVQLNDDMQEITFREQVIRPVKAIGEYVTPVFSLEGLGFACFENEDASGHCGTNLTIAPLYLNLQFNQEGACSEVEISNQGDLILGKYDFFHVIYDIRLDKTFYELGRDVDGSFKLSEFWVSADGEITPAEDGKELKIFKNEFEFMVGEEMEGAMAELTRFLEEIPVQEWGMDYLPLADLPMR